MAQPSRRSVLRGFVLLGATAAPLGAAEHAFSMVTGGYASGLRRTTFTPHLRSRFAFASDDGVYAAVLREVSDIRTSPRGHDRKFTLLFQVSGDPGAGTYRVKHPRIEDLDLFVSPVGGKPGLYEAVVDAL